MISNARKYARLCDEQLSLYESCTKEHGLNSKSLLVFMWIYRNPHEMTQESIVKRTFSMKQAIQVAVKTYMKKGTLYSEPSRIDRHKKLTCLTETGQQSAAELLEPLAGFEAQAMSALALEEQGVLLSATVMFIDKLKELLESHQVKEHVKRYSCIFCR